MAVQILIKVDGQPPMNIEGLRSFALVTIPEKNPQNDTSFTSFALTPKSIAECGAYMIRLAKTMISGKPLKPLGQRLSESESKIIKPRGNFDANNN
jgi:hypothetical protein